MMNSPGEAESIGDILIVDDIPANLKQLSEIVAKCGYRPRPAQNGEMALRAAVAAPPDLVLLDVRMPGMNGYEVCRRLKRIPRLQEIPIIFISALDETADKVEGFEAGGVDYITKPLQPAEVLVRVKTHLEIRRLQVSLRRAYEEAEHRAGQLRALTAELAQAEQRERRRMAQLLHDHLQQLLVAARVKLLMLSREDQGKARSDAHQTVIDLLDQCIAESRSLTVELSPPILYDAGLAAAFHWLARWMQQKHGFAVEVRVEDKAEVADEGVRMFLFEATRELLFNAVKHARVDGATVTITKAPNEMLKIEVHDSGIGFDPSRLEDQAASLGAFGLFNIRERLDLLGGSLEIETSPGRGTRAAILSPLSRRLPGTARDIADVGAPAHVCSGTTMAQARNGSPHVEPQDIIRLLLVDDHPILRKGLADLVRTSPEISIVGEAGDGQEAVEMALRLKPDVVLMDVTMPRMDGIEATRRISATLKEVRVIGLSMHEGEEMATAMRDAGAVAYMTKGGNPDALIAAIRHASI
jgi:CheY-like chemotaxis protein